MLPIPPQRPTPPPPPMLVDEWRVSSTLIRQSVPLVWYSTPHPRPLQAPHQEFQVLVSNVRCSAGAAAPGPAHSSAQKRKEAQGLEHLWAEATVLFSALCPPLMRVFNGWLQLLFLYCVGVGMHLRPQAQVHSPAHVLQFASSASTTGKHAAASKTPTWTCSGLSLVFHWWTIIRAVLFPTHMYVCGHTHTCTHTETHTKTHIHTCTHIQSCWQNTGLLLNSSQILFRV